MTERYSLPKKHLWIQGDDVGFDHKFCCTYCGRELYVSRQSLHMKINKITQRRYNQDSLLNSMKKEHMISGILNNIAQSRGTYYCDRKLLTAMQKIMDS